MSFSINFLAFRPFRRADSGPVNPYRISSLSTFMHRLMMRAPYRLREPLAERFLRRAGAPAPAAEHVFQYLLSVDQSKEEATVAKGADQFYARQYRQYLNPTMGAFAARATHAALAAGDEPARSGRVVRIAMSERVGAAHPILVLDHQSIATPIYLPPPGDHKERRALARWLKGHGEAPPCCSRLISGEEINCGRKSVSGRRVEASGAALALAHAALRSRKLALLALHPHDPDAMGLHLTLFDVEAISPKELIQDYALDAAVLDPWRRSAEARGLLLCFLVGGIEEAFTQCSQNLFVKRRAPAGGARRAQWPNAWAPHLSLENLLCRQFEILQATVSASGLPGLSPRNGDKGLAAFVAQDKGRTLVLIPYFAGNAVHGHAAKLLSNPNGALMIWDDHSALCAVTITGPARVVSHAYVAARFPQIAARIASRVRRSGAPADAPEYWFAHQVEEIVVQDEPLAANVLDPTRATCSIHAAGPALHGKKPAYFAADGLPPYDMRHQHERERAGRPRDPSGQSRRDWERELTPALDARLAHLARAGAD